MNVTFGGLLSHSVMFIPFLGCIFSLSLSCFVGAASVFELSALGWAGG